MFGIAAVLLFLAAVAVVATPLAPVFPVSVGGDPMYRVAPRSTAAVPSDTVLEQLGYDVKNGEMFLSDAELASIRAAGIVVDVLETAQPLKSKFIDIPAGYRSLAQIESYLASVAAQYPSIAQVVDLSATFDLPLSYEGRPFIGLKISDNVGEDEDEENMLIQGMHHAREIITPEICLAAVDRLTQGYGRDANMTHLVDNFEIWVWPVVNPDGLDYVWEVNNMWRKNRHPHGTAIGADNNRNYDLGWDSECGGSTVPSSDTYRGPSPASEEENQAMVGLTRQRNFRVVADFHSYGREVLYNYRCSPMPAAVSDYVERESNDIASYADYATRLPSADGGHCQWTIKETTLQCYLFETESEFQPSYQRCLAEIDRVWPAILQLLLRPSILSGHVIDAATNAPIRAQILATNVNWQMGETRFSTLPFGRYHYALPGGSYQLLFTAPGYANFTLAIALSETNPTVRDVFLTPLAAVSA